MRWIRCFSVASLMVVGLAAQSQAGLFDCFKKDAECGCAAPAPICTTSSACAPKTVCSTKPVCGDSACAPAGCASSPKPRGLFSCFSKKDDKGCAPAGCAPTSVCEPTCATPEKKGLFSCFSKKDKGCAPAGCAPATVCEPTCATPEKKGLFSCFSKKDKGCCPEPTCAAPCNATVCAPVRVSKPVCCTTDPGCTKTACGSCAACTTRAHVGMTAKKPVTNVAVVPNQSGAKTIQPLPSAPPKPATGNYFPSRIQEQQPTARRDQLNDLFGVQK